MGFLNTAEPCGSGPSVNGREGAAQACGGEAFADLCTVLCSHSIVLSNRRGSVMRAGNQRGPVSPAAARGQCLWDHEKCMRSHGMRSCVRKLFISFQVLLKETGQVFNSSFYR